MKLYKLHQQHNSYCSWTLTFVSNVLDLMLFHIQMLTSRFLWLCRSLHFKHVWQLNSSRGPSMTFSVTWLFVFMEALETAVYWQQFDEGQEPEPGKWSADLVTVYSVNTSHMSQSASCCCTAFLFLVSPSLFWIHPFFSSGCHREIKVLIWEL